MVQGRVFLETLRVEHVLKLPRPATIPNSSIHFSSGIPSFELPATSCQCREPSGEPSCKTHELPG